MGRHVSWSVRLPRALMLGVAVLLGGTAVAAPDKPENPGKARKQKPQQVIPTGAEDAAVPTAKEVLAEMELEQMTSRSTEGLEAVEHPDGTVSVDLEGRFMSIAVATPNAAGGHSVSCATGEDARSRARKARAVPVSTPLTPPAPAPAPQEEK